MSLMLMLDNDMGDEIHTLAPHRNVLDPNSPRSLTGVASIPKPVASTISAWLSRRDPPTPTQENSRFLMELAHE